MSRGSVARGYPDVSWEKSKQPRFLRPCLAGSLGLVMGLAAGLILTMGFAIGLAMGLDLAMGSGLVGSLGLAGSLEMGLGLGTSILEALAHSRPSS
jgi:hypothetical protein